MVLNYGLHIFCAAVPNFYCFSVKQLMQWVFWGEVFIEDSEEFVSKICGKVAVEEWVVPDYIFVFAFSLFLSLISRAFGLILFELLIVPTIFQRLMIVFFTFVKYFLTCGNFT